MHEKHEKTNAMRQLDRKKAVYTVYSYDGGALSGTEVAAALGQDPAHCFKTLVTVGRTGGYYVFMIPVAAELDLRKAASAAGEKSVAMLPQKELLPLTGYIHGGVQPHRHEKAVPHVCGCDDRGRRDRLLQRRPRRPADRNDARGPAERCSRHAGGPDGVIIAGERTAGPGAMLPTRTGRRYNGKRSRRGLQRRSLHKAAAREKNVAALPERHAVWQSLRHTFCGARLPSLSLRGAKRPWLSLWESCHRR